MTDADRLTTPQEEFWAGEFGTEYSDRNQGPDIVAGNAALFADVLRRMAVPTSVLEIGANVGLNLRALRALLPHVDLSAVEINSYAAKALRELDCDVIEDSILRWTPPAGAYDLVFTKGVLIHIEPASLPDVYDKMASASRRYVLMAEYYNPTPVTVTYRGNAERLFKRDFAGEFLDRHPDFALVDYAFCYHRGPFPQDDTTWFLMERTSRR